MLTNNDVLKKLRVALELKDEDVIHILSLVDFEISKAEIGALYRKEDHPNYRACGDQLLRNFLNGLVIYKRGPMPKRENSTQKLRRNNYSPRVSTKMISLSFITINLSLKSAPIIFLKAFLLSLKFS